VQPTSGETLWYLCSGLSKPFFAELLALFARETGAGRERSIILVLDNAGWHGPKDLAIPEGISLVFLPPYSPELQPAEHLWPLVDEPIANRHVASLDDLSTILAARCRQLDAATLQPHTDFHWWPKPIQPSWSPGDGMIPDPVDRISWTDRPPPGAMAAVVLINRIPYEYSWPLRPPPSPPPSATGRRHGLNVGVFR
jgi:transposase